MSHNLLILLGECFLPPKERTSLSFLQQVLSGEKELLMDEEVKRLKIPKWPELNVKALMPEVIKNAEVYKYLPDWKEG